MEVSIYYIYIYNIHTSNCQFWPLLDRNGEWHRDDATRGPHICGHVFAHFNFLFVFLRFLTPHHNSHIKIALVLEWIYFMNILTVTE